MSKRLNDYDILSGGYQDVHPKPDTQYSQLPTVLMLAGDVTDRVVLDLGCGDGFFARAFAAKGAARVIGIDNSEKQLELARKRRDSVEYLLQDIFLDDLPRADLVCAPYVLNYSNSVEELAHILGKIRNCLNPGGILIGVVDLPEGRDLRKYGAQKILAANVDGADITINLYNNGKLVIPLHSRYFSHKTITATLRNVGFSASIWARPIIVQAGIEAFGKDFWNGYADHPELGYFKAIA